MYEFTNLPLKVPETVLMWTNSWQVKAATSAAACHILEQLSYTTIVYCFVLFKHIVISWPHNHLSIHNRHTTAVCHKGYWNTQTDCNMDQTHIHQGTLQDVLWRLDQQCILNSKLSLRPCQHSSAVFINNLQYMFQRQVEAFLTDLWLG